MHPNRQVSRPLTRVASALVLGLGVAALLALLGAAWMTVLLLACVALGLSVYAVRTARLVARLDGRVRELETHQHTDAELRQAHATERGRRGELERVLSAESAVTEALTDLPQAGLEHVLTTIALQARALTGASMAAIGLGTHPELPFSPWISLGLDDRLGPAPRPVGLLAETALHGRVVRVDGDATIGAFLGVPIWFRHRLVGNLYLAHDANGTGFSADDERTVVQLAQHAGSAIETANAFSTREGRLRQRDRTFEQMPAPVLVFDAEHRVVELSLACRALFVMPHQDEVVAGATFELREPRGAALPLERWPSWRAIHEGATVLVEELEANGPGGQRILCQVSATALDTGGAIMVLRDIRAQKEIEDLRSAWSGIVAHDLRQPLSTVSMAAQLLARDLAAVPGTFPSFALERIADATRRLDRMVGDLVDLSSIEAQCLSIQRERIDLRSLVERVGAELQASCPDRQLVLALPPAPLHHELDPDRIQQVVTNLVSNAFKYSTAGTAIELSLLAQATHVELTVSNHGPGIPPEQQHTLFTRFGRTTDARAGLVAGTGLGLYITRGLVEAHGGRIRVDSPPGAATTFTVTLPLV